MNSFNLIKTERKNYKICQAIKLRNNTNKSIKINKKHRPSQD